MRYLELDGAKLSVVGLGCWQFGEPGWGYGQEFGPKDSLAIIRRALELGVTLIDTAELYGSGASESLVGTALQEWAEPVFLASKFLPLMPVPGPMVAHCRRSLERLQRPALDLYQIHFPNPVVPLRLQMDGLRQVLHRGLSQHVGVSNFSLSRWRRAERLLGSPIISNQVRYNLLHRRPEQDLISYADRTSHLIIAYSPLAQGALSGRYRQGLVPAGLRRRSWLFTEEGLTAAEPVVEALREVAAGKGVTPDQVALAYLLAQPRVLVIPGAKSIAQLEANVAATEIVLAPDELLALRRGADLFQMSRRRAATQLLGGLVRGGGAANA
ncbi:MAG: aldo/keto reductase [Candidatus Dormibacteria bacterium]